MLGEVKRRKRKIQGYSLLSPGLRSTQGEGAKRAEEALKRFKDGNAFALERAANTGYGSGSTVSVAGG